MFNYSFPEGKGLFFLGRARLFLGGGLDEIVSDLFSGKRDVSPPLPFFFRLEAFFPPEGSLFFSFLRRSPIFLSRPSTRQTDPSFPATSLIVSFAWALLFYL